MIQHSVMPDDSGQSAAGAAVAPPRLDEGKGLGGGGNVCTCMSPEHVHPHRLGVTTLCVAGASGGGTYTACRSLRPREEDTPAHQSAPSGRRHPVAAPAPCRRASPSAPCRFARSCRANRSGGTRRKRPRMVAAGPGRCGPLLALLLTGAWLFSAAQPVTDLALGFEGSSNTADWSLYVKTGPTDSPSATFSGASPDARRTGGSGLMVNVQRTSSQQWHCMLQVRAAAPPGV